MEPFCGAAALFFYKEPSKVEVLNDINGEIINLFRVVKFHIEELCRQFKWALTSRENWKRLQQTPPETLTDVQRAARFLYLQKLAFGGRATSQSFGVDSTRRSPFNIFSLEQDLEDAHFRLSHVTIEHLDWREAVRRYDRPHTLFYCDPPYWKVEGYGVDFGWEQYEELARLARTIKGKMIISINDHPEIRALLKDLPMRKVDYTYTVGGGNRRANRKELIYCTWPGSVSKKKGRSKRAF